VIKQFEMARRSGHEKENDAFGFGGKMRLFGRKRIVWRNRCETGFAKQTSQRNRPETNATLLKKPTARY
jgi:hypothetical protein